MSLNQAAAQAINPPEAGSVVIHVTFKELKTLLKTPANTPTDVMNIIHKLASDSKDLASNVEKVNWGTNQVSRKHEDCVMCNYLYYCGRP
jgi:hypothetical protein